MALFGLIWKKLITPALIRIEFWMKYQILDFFDPQAFLAFFARPWLFGRLNEAGRVEMSMDLAARATRVALQHIECYSVFNSESTNKWRPNFFCSFVVCVAAN